MRAFIGILVSENVRNVAVKMQEELKKVGIVGKYVEIKNLHVNLSFIGEISESESLEIAAKMDMIARGYKKFKVSIVAVKAIPNKKIVRVVAFDVVQENELLRSLSKDVQKSIGGDVKPPHMTLCRVKGLKDKRKFFEFVESYEKTSFVEFDVNSVQLIKSELDKEGPIYTIIHESKFSS